MAEKHECRFFKAGEGRINLLPDEWVILLFNCRDCGKPTSTAILGPSTTFVLDSDEARSCRECQKRSLIRILKDTGCKVPDEQLLKMSVDQLLSIPSSPPA